MRNGARDGSGPAARPARRPTPDGGEGVGDGSRGPLAGSLLAGVPHAHSETVTRPRMKPDRVGARRGDDPYVDAETLVLPARRPGRTASTGPGDRRHT
jgi:hypothetical protein